MGKLTELVKFRNSLVDSREFLTLSENIQNKVEVLDQLISNTDLADIVPSLAAINKNLDNMFLENQMILDNISTAVDLLNQTIDQLAATTFTGATYSNKFSEETVFQTLPVSPKIDSWIEAKITQHSSWHYPALQITPRSKKNIDIMVASDPLYLTHHNINVLTELINEYPMIYQNRLRLYEITSRDFQRLPKDQFSNVICWDSFNYLSSDKIEQYLKEVFTLLRPGGKFVFSYNNCDLESSMYRAECIDASFASARWLSKLATEIGYEIIGFTDYETEDSITTYVSFGELKKSGVLSTVKAHQAFAKINEK